MAPAARTPEALLELFDETRLLFHRMRALAAAVHGQGEASAARRNLLVEIARLGPRTVARMARARPVSRQHIQKLVDGLADDGLVELVANPAHRRSPLVALSRRGRELAAEMAERETRVLSASPTGVSDRSLREAVATLRAVREALADTDWAARAEEVAPLKKRRTRR
jgi:DNA-binding MarR family transcriptional regulator